MTSFWDITDFFFFFFFFYVYFGRVHPTDEKSAEYSWSHLGGRPIKVVNTWQWNSQVAFILI